MSVNPAFAYVAGRHFTVINKHSGERIDYCPGDLVLDFCEWDEPIRRAYLDNHYVSIAMPDVNAQPPVDGGHRVDKFVGVRPDKALHGPEAPKAPWVPLGEDKPATVPEAVKTAVMSHMDETAAAIAAGVVPDAPPSIMPRGTKAKSRKAQAEIP